jgi:predicted nucleotidyltransferase
MLQYGIEHDIWEKIISVLKAESKITSIILFGSRAKGNFQNGSDIDIALKGHELKFDDIQNLRITLDELNLPWEIDVQNYDTINDPDVKEHIDRVGIKINKLSKLK